MIGNDVVDLRDPDSDVKTHPSRFDERVFSPEEQRLVREAPDAARLRWQLWAAKEASFKAARKRDSATVFSPPRFEVELDGPLKGRVVHRREGIAPENFDFRCWVADDVVHAVAREEACEVPDSALLIHGVRRLEPHESAGAIAADSIWGPSRAARDFACERLSRALDVPRESLEIRTPERVPILWLDQRPASADLSLSHHGEWIAFACRIEASAARGRDFPLRERPW